MHEEYEKRGTNEVWCTLHKCRPMECFFLPHGGPAKSKMTEVCDICSHNHVGSYACTVMVGTLECKCLT